MTTLKTVDGREPEHGVELAVEVSEDGQFAPDVAGYARQQVRAAAKHCHAPILRASVRLVRYHDPALDRPVISRATLNVNGRLVRVQTAAPSAVEGLDALQHVLRTALDRLDRQQDHHRRGHPEPAHTIDEPQIRRPAVQAGACSVDEAIGTLDALDRDFQLFGDLDTGIDSVVFRASPTGYRLAQVHPRPLGRPPQEPVSIETDAAPRLSVEAAAQRLACNGAPFVFFADSVTGRGSVLHVRYDGYYGLVTVGGIGSE